MRLHDRAFTDDKTQGQSKPGSDFNFDPTRITILSRGPLNIFVH